MGKRIIPDFIRKGCEGKDFSYKKAYISCYRRMEEELDMKAIDRWDLDLGRFYVTCSSCYEEGAYSIDTTDREDWVHERE